MSPNSPVSEKECANVTLQCKINSGNPAELEEVTVFFYLQFKS